MLRAKANAFDDQAQAVFDAENMPHRSGEALDLR